MISTSLYKIMRYMAESGMVTSNLVPARHTDGEVVPVTLQHKSLTIAMHEAAATPHSTVVLLAPHIDAMYFSIRCKRIATTGASPANYENSFVIDDLLSSPLASSY